MTVEVSVVVCAHDEDRWEQISHALSSLERQTVAPREVIVVVDGNERLGERLRSELGARAIPNTLAPGLGGARNSGLAAASGAVVAFLDDDAVASPQWVERLAAPYADERVAAVGGSAEPVWEGDRPAWFPPEFDWVVGCSYLGMPERAQPVRNLFGCNMSFRRRLLEELGGFRLGYGCDETELCIRLAQRWPDKQILYLPEAKILHHVPADRVRLLRFLRRCYFEGGSKAVVAKLVGADRGLATERRYALAVLPRGVLRGVAVCLRRGEMAGLARAAAIVAGLAATTAGYLAARLSIAEAARRRGWSGEL
jgi:glycosyltransferase involved in cell wall biosynthesis